VQELAQAPVQVLAARVPGPVQARVPPVPGLVRAPVRELPGQDPALRELGPRARPVVRAQPAPRVVVRREV
jgi:hypothetical protein